MNTLITKNNHGFADYTYVPLAFAAPVLAGFREEKKAVAFCLLLSSTVLGYTLLTDAKWGAIKLIPYKTHAALDVAVGVITLASPLVIKPANKKAKRTLITMGIVAIVVGALSLLSNDN